MANIEKMVAQLDELLTQYEASTQDEIDEGHATFALIVYRLEAAIDRIALPGSTYIKQLDLCRGYKNVAYKAYPVYITARALRDDLKAGWVESIVELVHADTYGDYLEMADELLGKGYKDPTAVIAGTTLEVHVRALCVKHGVDTERPDGSPKKADTMNTDLKKAGVYDTLRQKQLTAWMDLRNKAAHGDYQAYGEADIRLLVQGVRDFMLRYPA
jgi:hypothetical protein